MREADRGRIVREIPWQTEAGIMREREGRSRADHEREREREAYKLKIGSGRHGVIGTREFEIVFKRFLKKLY